MAQKMFLWHEVAEKFSRREAEEEEEGRGGGERRSPGEGGITSPSGGDREAPPTDLCAVEPLVFSLHFPPRWD